MTFVLFLSVFSAVFGGAFQYGYNIAVVNAPANVSFTNSLTAVVAASPGTLLRTSLAAPCIDLQIIKAYFFGNSDHNDTDTQTDFTVATQSGSTEVKFGFRFT